MQIDESFQGPAHRNRVALIILLLIVTSIAMMFQFAYLNQAYIWPAFISSISDGEVEMLDEDADDDLAMQRLVEARNMAIAGTIFSLLLLPIHIAWVLKSSLWGRKASIAWIVVFLLFNTLGMFIFSLWSAQRHALRRPPRPLKPRQAARTERLLAEHGIARESLDDAMFEFLGQRLIKLRRFRIGSMIGLVASILVVTLFAFTLHMVSTRMLDASFFPTLDVERLAEESDCEELDKMAETMEEHDFALVSTLALKFMVGMIGLIVVIMAMFVGAMLMMTLLYASFTAIEARVIAEFIHALKKSASATAMQ